mmetsp:Transcript_45806/g.103708  ORF Transcript_45806/g.103708 Transcript_45806/m.103708 type:complete len:127 (+) Transcript_45806:702-1082(+)
MPRVHGRLLPGCTSVVSTDSQKQWRLKTWHRRLQSFFLGFAGWHSDQLRCEIERGVWWVARQDPSSEAEPALDGMVFSALGKKELLWQRCLRGLFPQSEWHKEVSAVPPEWWQREEVVEVFMQNHE